MIIRVATIYENDGKIRPIWFDLAGEKFTVKEICYIWDSEEGAARIIHFSVTTDKGLYELKFNTAEQKWQVIQQ